VYLAWFLLSVSVYAYFALSSTPIDITSIAFLPVSSYNFALMVFLGLVISCFAKGETSILAMFVVALADSMQLSRGLGFIITGRLDFYVHTALISGIIGVSGLIAIILYDYLKTGARSKHGES
jgi:hypothetical protein